MYLLGSCIRRRPGCGHRCQSYRLPGSSGLYWSDFWLRWRAVGLQWMVLRCIFPYFTEIVSIPGAFGLCLLPHSLCNGGDGQRTGDATSSPTDGDKDHFEWIHSLSEIGYNGLCTATTHWGTFSTLPGNNSAFSREQPWSLPTRCVDFQISVQLEYNWVFWVRSTRNQKKWGFRGNGTE